MRLKLKILEQMSLMDLPKLVWKHLNSIPIYWCFKINKMFLRIQLKDLGLLQVRVMLHHMIKQLWFKFLPPLHLNLFNKIWYQNIESQVIATHSRFNSNWVLHNQFNLLINNSSLRRVKVTLDLIPRREIALNVMVELYSKIRMLQLTIQNKITQQLFHHLSSMVVIRKIQHLFQREQHQWGRVKKKVWLPLIIRAINNLHLLVKKATEKKEVILHHQLIEVHKFLKQSIKMLGKRLLFLISWITLRKSIWMEQGLFQILQYTKKSACHLNRQTIVHHFMDKISMVLESLRDHLQLVTCPRRQVGRTPIIITIISQDSPLSNQTISRHNKLTWLRLKSWTWEIII